MLTRTARAFTLGLLGASLACQGTDISAGIDEYAELRNETRMLACECPEDLFYQTSAECIAALGTVGDPERECMSDALDGDREAGMDYLTCANSALADYSECLVANPGCQNGWYEECVMELSSALNACGALVAADARATFSACTQ